MNCVNTKSKEFQELLEASKLPSLLLEMKVSEFQEKNGLDSFPKLKDVSDKSVLNKKETTLDKLIKLESNEAESIFSTPPVVNRADGLDTGNELVDKLFSSTDTIYPLSSIISKLERIFINTDNEFMVDVLSKLSKLKSSHNVKVRSYNSDHFDKGTMMTYDSDISEIQISTDILKGFSDEAIVSTLLHELTHHITVDVLSRPEKDLTYSEKEFVQTVKKFYNKYKSNNHRLSSDANFRYGFESIEEFVAEFYGNPDFREYTKTLSDNWYNDFIKFFKDALRRMLNIPKNKEFDTLMDKVFNYVENTEDVTKSLYRKQDIFAKQIKPAEDYDLTTVSKKADYLVDKVKDRIKQLTSRAKKGQKKGRKERVERYKTLSKEIESLSELSKIKAIISYIGSFQNTLSSLNNSLDAKFKMTKVTYEGVVYNKVPNAEVFRSDFNKYIAPSDISLNEEFKAANDFVIDSELYNNIENKAIAEFTSQDFLDIANDYDGYLAAYDLLKDVKDLLASARKDSTLSREEKLDFRILDSKINELSAPHDAIEGKIKKLKKESMVKLLSDPSNNKRVITKWKKKLELEYKKLSNPNYSVTEWIGIQMATTYKDKIDEDLKEDANKIISNPYMDISSMELNLSDLLNTNSPLINVISNVIGKLRDVIIAESNKASFVFDKAFKKYSSFNDSLSMSKKYGNLVELNKATDKYYLKATYSVEFLESYNKMRAAVKDQYKDEVDVKEKETVEYKNWLKENTVDEGGSPAPHPKFLNKNLTPQELETIEFFKKKTKDNNNNAYNKRGGLIRTLYGAEFYKLPSKTKSAKERTLEGDIKGQVIDQWTDLTQQKVDDIEHGTAFDSKGQELRRVKINFRGKIESVDQSLDLFTVYRAEEVNAIKFKHRSANENKLKLFVDIAKDKEYKKKSLTGSGWAKNMFAGKEVGGQVFSGSESNELKKIKGILETALYDITSYSDTKLGTADANKIVGKINSMAATLAMTANLGSATVNALNGQMMLVMERFGSKYIKKDSLLQAEINYSKNLPSIMADIQNPVKKSFTNQMLNMFDIIGGNNMTKQDFMNNSTTKELMSSHNLNFMNDGVEHMLSSVLTESVLRSIPVMNKDHKYVDKEGNVVDKDKAASIFDMLYLDEDGVLQAKKHFVYSEYNLVDSYHEDGKQSINYLLKKQVHNLYGVYDANFKPEAAKTWIGKLGLMFKSFFISQAQYRYKGISSATKSKDDLTDEELTYNNAEQEYTEGTYVTLVRTFWPLLRRLNVALTKENLNDLSDYERANLRKAFLEIAVTSIVLPLIGAILAASAGDDDDELFFLLYSFRRLESELSQFRNPAELNRMITNPIAANRFLQNGFAVLNDIITPINFTPTKDESYLDWLSENSKGDNKMLHNAFKLAPGKSLFMNTYEQRYNLMK